MPLFTVHNRMGGTQQANTTTFKTQVGLAAVTATLRRGKVMELAFGADDAYNSTDCQIAYDVSRQTAAGTGTAATPVPDDPADGVSGTAGLNNDTVEPTVTAASTLWGRVLNQRASQQWQAVGEQDALIWPATNANGLVLRSLSPVFVGKTFMSAKFLE